MQRPHKFGARLNTPMKQLAAAEAEAMILDLGKKIRKAIEDHPYLGQDKSDLLKVVTKREQALLEEVSLIFADVSVAGIGKSAAISSRIASRSSHTRWTTISAG
jgi:hypothetical protein